MALLIIDSTKMCDPGPTVTKSVERIQGMALEMQLFKMLVTSMNLNLRWLRCTLCL